MYYTCPALSSMLNVTIRITNVICHLLMCRALYKPFICILLFIPRKTCAVLRSLGWRRTVAFQRPELQPRGLTSSFLRRYTVGIFTPACHRGLLSIRGDQAHGKGFGGTLPYVHCGDTTEANPIYRDGIWHLHSHVPLPSPISLFSGCGSWNSAVSSAPSWTHL